MRTDDDGFKTELEEIMVKVIKCMKKVSHQQWEVSTVSLTGTQQA
jgi:hypothetical protein